MFSTTSTPPSSSASVVNPTSFPSFHVQEIRHVNNNNNYVVSFSSNDPRHNINSSSSSASSIRDHGLLQDIIVPSQIMMRKEYKGETLNDH